MGGSFRFKEFFETRIIDEKSKNWGYLNSRVWIFGTVFQVFQVYPKNFFFLSLRNMSVFIIYNYVPICKYVRNYL